MSRNSLASGPALAVTGSTGWLGGLVAGDLAERGQPQRLVVRDASRAPGLPGAVVVQADYADGAAARQALDGARLLFMVSAAEDEQRLDGHRTFVDAAVAAGVEHIVYVSFFGAAQDATFTLARDHWATEEHIKASGIGWTFLRDNLYLEFIEHLAGPDRVIRGPAGEGRAAMVAHADIARVATAVLLEPDAHGAATYSLTGPESVTLAQAAAIFSEVTGNELTFADESLEEAYASRASYGAPKWQVDAWVSTYTAIAKGELDGVTDDVERITGRRPLSIREHFAARRGQA